MTLKNHQNAAAPSEEEQRGVVACGQETFKWEFLVPVFIHPVRVAIVEAMLWLERAISAKELSNMFEKPEDPSVSLIAYHMRRLAERGVIEKTGFRFNRAAEESFYFLSPAMTTRANGGAHE